MATRSETYARVQGANPVLALSDVTDRDLSVVRTLVEQRRTPMATSADTAPIVEPAPPSRPRFRWAVAAAAAVVVLASVGIAVLVFRGSHIDPAKEPTTTTAVTTTTIENVPPATIPGAAQPDWETGSYQSRYYSCGPDPTTGCTADDPLSLNTLWIGHDYEGIDYIDFIAAPRADRLAPEAYAHWLDLRGGPDDIPPDVGELGHGVRVTQLDAPPDGLAISGESWLEVTISGFSATDFADRPPHFPRQVVDAPTSTNPVAIVPRESATQYIAELVLVATAPDMMQWVIGLTEPGSYDYSVVGYWSISNGESALSIWIRRSPSTL